MAVDNINGNGRYYDQSYIDNMRKSYEEREKTKDSQTQKAISDIQTDRDETVKRLQQQNSRDVNKQRDFYEKQLNENEEKNEYKFDKTKNELLEQNNKNADNYRTALATSREKYKTVIDKKDEEMQNKYSQQKDVYEANMTDREKMFRKEYMGQKEQFGKEMLENREKNSEQINEMDADYKNRVQERVDKERMQAESLYSNMKNKIADTERRRAYEIEDQKSKYNSLIGQQELLNNRNYKEMQERSDVAKTEFKTDAQERVKNIDDSVGKRLDRLQDSYSDKFRESNQKYDDNVVNLKDTSARNIIAERKGSQERLKQLVGEFETEKSREAERQGNVIRKSKEDMSKETTKVILDYQGKLTDQSSFYDKEIDKKEKINDSKMAYMSKEYKDIISDQQYTADQKLKVMREDFINQQRDMQTTFLGRIAEMNQEHAKTIVKIQMEADDGVKKAQGRFDEFQKEMLRKHTEDMQVEKDKGMLMLKDQKILFEKEKRDMDGNFKNRLEEQKATYDRNLSQLKEQQDSRLESIRLEFKDQIDKQRDINIKDKQELMARLENKRKA